MQMNEDRAKRTQTLLWAVFGWLAVLMNFSRVEFEIFIFIS
jgi:hypothetical protein